ncbi:hypothetical protein [Acetobacter fallax]|uniref:Uncharacterized protein n=1 Tax=Acetobacter fallax TaxID=1737473 RepID=A0ABX0K741_9PROT|nr:hypothetical protein [Acetobacter fallax]NHO32212.1 hypothetical protein [Acetobacter fallax]NHO35735.1 hypothetical protein [Acetobacter fallax]
MSVPTRGRLPPTEMSPSRCWMPASQIMREAGQSHRVIRVLVMQGGAIIPYAFSDQPLCDVRQENILTNMPLILVTMLNSSDQGIQLLLRTVISLRPALYRLIRTALSGVRETKALRGTTGSGILEPVRRVRDMLKAGRVFGNPACVEAGSRRSVSIW